MKKHLFVFLGLPCLIAVALACGLAWADLSTSFQRSQDTRGSFGVDSTGTHFLNVGPPPVITLCGVSAGTVAGTDHSGAITIGTGGSAGCNLAFATAYATAPRCVLTWRSTNTAMAYTVATNGIWITQTGGAPSSATLIDYLCESSG